MRKLTYDEPTGDNNAQTFNGREVACILYYYTSARRTITARTWLAVGAQRGCLLVVVEKGRRYRLGPI
jgi:hypothetical protein